MEFDQQNKLQINKNRLKNKNQKLLTEMFKRNIHCENLKDELKKSHALSKNIEIINKEKLIQYEKKMATLSQ